MPNIACRPSVAVLGVSFAALGVYALAQGGSTAAPVAEHPATAAISPQPAAVAVREAPRLLGIDTPVIEPEDDGDVDEVIRGHATIEDPAEFAFVFEIDGVSYVRLSDEERASARGRARLVEADYVHSAIAPVEPSALPAHLRGWAGRTVLVDGTCSARVVGFAEISRMSGDPMEYDEERNEPLKWTAESLADTNVMLAARLDRCSGSWARAESYPAAAVATAVDAPELEDAAKRDILARSADDPVQREWADSGGEGDWRTEVVVDTHVYQHAATGERWVIAQARRGNDGCGDPGISRMAVYRVNADGSVRRFADLGEGTSPINEVVDLDGDGQPEIVMGSGDSVHMVDLAGEHHGSISVPYQGCGC